MLNELLGISAELIVFIPLTEFGVKIVNFCEGSSKKVPV